MLEKVSNKDIIVTNYTSNFDVKEYIQEVLIPKAFPNIPMNKLNLGFTGVVSEYISQAIEDAYASGSLMLNETFITKSILPGSIYAHGSLFNLGYTFAKPSHCDFALEISIADIVKYAEVVQNTTTYRYVLDKDTRIILGDNVYKLDYDIFIEYTIINKKRIFNVYYNMEEINSISSVSTKYIKHQTSGSTWLILFLDLMEFDRKTDTASITDNMLTTNSDIKITWTRDIAGLDLVYISPQGQRIPMILKTKYTNPDFNAFAWYSFVDDYTISLSFSNNTGYWTPDFNSKIEWTVYTTSGARGNFDSYDRKTGVPVKKTGDRYSYNADTMIVALCYSGSVGGVNRGDIEALRDDIILAYNTANVLTTDNDLQMWFENNAKKNGTKSKFFKRRDDPSGRLFAQFISIIQDSYIYHTNTLSALIIPRLCDYYVEDGENGDEYIVAPGHLWEYDYASNPVEPDPRGRVRMLTDYQGRPIKITDPYSSIVGDPKFIFINPFYIKIHRNPDANMMYNYLISDTSWPEDTEVSTTSFYRFQLGQFYIERSLTTEATNKYHFEVVCVPVISTDENIDYVEHLNEDYDTNNLRLVFITRSQSQDTGFIEMKPIEKLEGGSILFATDLYIEDNLRDDMTIKILKDESGIHPIAGEDADVFIDSMNTSFDFITLIKDSNSGTPLFDGIEGSNFSGYVITNRFRNRYRELDLYKPMGMMRSNMKFWTFDEDEDEYRIATKDDRVDALYSSLIPFIDYQTAIDPERMKYFIKTFDDQYAAMEPVLSKMDGNSFIDFKLFNTYGKSNNYYIGPENPGEELKKSTILLDDVYVVVNLTMSVYDRSIYTQTELEVKSRIISLFDNLISNNNDIHASNIIHDIIENVPNVKYVRFDGFDDYPVHMSSIFIKNTDESLMNETQLSKLVPEIIRVDEDSIIITEET